MTLNLNATTDYANVAGNTPLFTGTGLSEGLEISVLIDENLYEKGFAYTVLDDVPASAITRAANTVYAVGGDMIRIPPRFLLPFLSISCNSLSEAFFI